MRLVLSALMVCHYPDVDGVLIKYLKHVFSFNDKDLFIHFSSLQEPMVQTPQHKDYLPDVTNPDPASDYEHEEDDQGPGGAEEEYDDYPENGQQMQDRKKKKKK